MPNLGYLIVNGVWLLALSVWVGGGLTTTFIVAPTVFARAPSRALAGDLMGEILRRQGRTTLVAMVVLAATGGIRAALWESAAWPILLRYGLLAVACALVVAGLTLVDPKIRAHRAALGGPIDDLAADDPRRRAFARLHGIAMALNLAHLLLATGALMLS
jgi:uncharacterized membrane protein